MVNPYFSGFLFCNSFFIFIPVSTIIRSVSVIFKNISILRDVIPKTIRLAGISFSCATTAPRLVKSLVIIVVNSVDYLGKPNIPCFRMGSLLGILSCTKVYVYQEQLSCHRCSSGWCILVVLQA